MKTLFRIIELVDVINKSFDKDEVNARLHMTRHEIKVEVFDNRFLSPTAPVREKIRYFNTEKGEAKLLEVEKKLIGFLGV